MINKFKGLLKKTNYFILCKKISYNNKYVDKSSNKFKFYLKKLEKLY